ncbi:FAD/NAD(P)-binding domain-containing protein [Eremomyces bilateralis CBS 781.70]|uniref:FAD/NAD(P)-binding domain-containing protein n=1 Tax=Eremomyces bilateralis CBS 781.70 TaxID=1392243 RepID=A0A6G1FUA8_9PEZI|nr:FAD/NAD(P)-binding domain-containing protein [Eremomyces bilateralis CBS 781.70]KAF1809387.1 FAD/NAD(P)-binding domain-containing protein [Eremomyces bilateralis CBS 781.70]
MANQIPPRTGNPESDAQRRLLGPIHAERHVRIICVGAGASGLLLAYKLQRHFQNYSLTIYEKNPKISGTWYENRYPGCACDIPAHTYTWSFEPKPDWSAVYAGSKEINQYFEDFAQKYHLHQYIKPLHEVSGAYWNEKQAGYDVHIKDLNAGTEIVDSCDILINASGILNHWKWPAIPGLHDYKGKLLHTASWDDNVELKGKHVGLIGNGSSGIQVLPTIQPHVSKCTTFIREPTWVSPVQGLEQHKYTEEEKQDFVGKPGALTEYRKNVESGLNAQFGIFLKGSQINSETSDYMKELMKEKLHNQFLEEKLIPEWSVGCRRLTPGVGYLEALGEENVQVVYGEITKVTERGCVCDDGNEYPVDVLICATGFDTGFKPRFPIIGPGGANLQDEWAKQAESYLGVSAAGFPNYMLFLGPNCPIGNGPVLSAIETQADYMLKLVDRWQTHNIRTFSPTKAAIQDFVAHKDFFMKRTVWADPCRSWYKASAVDDTVTALWPGSTLHYIEAMQELRLEDYEIGYAGNRFAWLGNGYSQTELDETCDWAFYIREYDDDLPITKDGKRKLLTRSGTVTNHSAPVGITGAAQPKI